MKTVFIGGFAESKPSLRHVATFIEEITGDEVAVFTFAEAMQDPENVKKQSSGAQVVTHSSGCLVLQHKLGAARIIAISPSQPISKGRLFIRATQKTFAHLLRLFAMPLNMLPVAAVLASNGLELLRHPIGNFRHLFSGVISSFDISDVVHLHKSMTIVIALDDEMFRLEEHAVTKVNKTHVQVVTIEASHDEMFISPRKMLHEISLQ